ncbi:MAG: Beta-barrel assembly-enhancing protease [bacterium]|nr:Beta-barrel assembly-enhancing protease [bacterium]
MVLGGLFSPAKKLEGLIRNGEAALQKRDFTQAGTLFEQAKELLEKHKGTKDVDALGIRVLVGLARALDGQGRRESVFQYLDRALEFEGDKSQLLETLGNTYSTSNKEPVGPGAYRVYKKGYALAPGNERILLGYASGAWEAQEFTPETQKVFERAWRAHKDLISAVQGLGACYAQLAKYDQEALEVYRQLLKLDPQNEEHRLNVARCYSHLTNPPKDAYTVLQWARKLRPEDRLFFDGLTRIYLQSDEMLESIYEHLLDAYNLTPSTAIGRRLLPYLLRAKDTSEFAVEIYEQFWQNHERKEQILHLLSEHYLHSQRNDGTAREVYEALYDLNPGALANTQILAKMYAQEGRNDERAVGVYELALQGVDGASAAAIIHSLARGYLSAGRKDAKAREIYFRALAEKPQDHQVLLVLCEIALAKKVLDDRDLMVLERAFKLPATPKETRLKAAEVLAEHFIPRQRTDDLAIQLYRYLWQNTPEQLSALGVQLLASSLVAAGEGLKEAPLLKKALENRYDPAIGVALAQSYLADKRMDGEALAHYLRVLREDPTNEAIVEAVTPRILDKQDPDPQYYPIIIGALERNPKPVLQRLEGPKGRATLLTMAKTLLERRRYRQAQVVLEAARQINTNDAEIDYLLAVSMAAQGQANLAYPILQHLAKANPSPLVQYRLGHVAMLDGKHKEAAQVFAELAKAHPDHPLLIARQGQLAEATGQQKEAETLYKALAASKSSYAPYGTLKLALLHSTNGTLVDTASISAITEDKIFGSQAQSLLAAAQFRTGRAEFERNNYRAAARAWEQALELTSQQSPNPIAPCLSEAIFRLGVEAFSREEYTQAEAHFRKAADVDPEHGAAALFEGAACHASGKIIKAKACYERVLDRYPALRPEVALLYGKLELHKKHYDLANDILEGALEGKFRPYALLGRAISYYLNEDEERLPAVLQGNAMMEIYEAGLLHPAFMGVLHYQAGTAREGAALLEKVVQKDLAEKSFPFEGLFILGLLYIKADQRKLALYHWQRLLDLSVQDILRMGEERGIPKVKMVELYYSLLYRYLADSMVEEATGVLQKLEQMDPEGQDLAIARSYLALHKGYLAAKEQAYHHAINFWKDALKHAPNLAAYQNLGLVEMIKAHPDQALRYWKTFFEFMEKKVKVAPDENDVIQLNETRRIVNLLNTFQEEEEFKAAVKKEILIDDIEQVNSHYWTLGLTKGATVQDAEKSYFRLIRTYNPERYPKEFMTIEAAYQFFQDGPRLRKAEILVFNCFNLHKALRASRLPFKWGLPELPAINREVDGFVATDRVGKIVQPKQYVQKPALDAVGETLEVGDVQLVDFLATW